MPLTVTTTRIFNRAMTPAAVNRSLRFTAADFIYMIAPDLADTEIEIDAFLQIFLPFGTERKIQIESPSIVSGVNQLNTETVTRIPLEFKGYEMELAITPSSNDYLEVWVSASSLPCDVLEEQLDRIETKVNLCVVSNVISTIVDIVTTGIFDGILDQVGKRILAPSARKAFKILNPVGSDSPIWVDILPSLPELPNTINQASFETIIQPGFEWQPTFGYPDQHIVGWTQQGKTVSGINVREYF